MGFEGWGFKRSDNGENLIKIWKIARQDVMKFFNEYGRGHIRIKAINCGKKACKSCPHNFYAYLVNRWGKEKYLGACNAKGEPRRVLVANSANKKNSKKKKK
jgi:hypothetical protein